MARLKKLYYCDICLFSIIIFLKEDLRNNSNENSPGLNRWFPFTLINYHIMNLVVDFEVQINNPFQATDLLLYPLETSGNFWLSDFFRRYWKRLVTWNGLILVKLSYGTCKAFSQPAFTYSNSTIETLEQCVKSVQC